MVQMNKFGLFRVNAVPKTKRENSYLIKRKLCEESL